MLYKKDIYQRIEQARTKRFSMADEDAIAYHNGYMHLLDLVEKYLDTTDDKYLYSFLNFLSHITPSTNQDMFCRGMRDASNRVIMYHAR